VSTYKSTGVDISAGSRAVALMKQAVQSTHGPEVLAGVGSFGGVFDAGRLRSMESPLLVSSTDGVGTKTVLAMQMKVYSTIGQDLVNHCVNDILVQGAEPLFFMDYIAMNRLEPETVAEVVRGAAAACLANGCALLGGETAEMPDVYKPGELDLAGTIVGVVDRSQLVDGSKVQPGDVLIGLPSTGLHTNGYSLARRIAAGRLEESLAGTTVGQALLAIHKSYLSEVQTLRHSGLPVHAMAHITGGGIWDNLPRVLPPGVSVELNRGSWPVPPILAWLVEEGSIEEYEAYHALNMGLGFVLVVPQESASQVLSLIPAYPIGQVVKGDKQVQLV
jgi:phosphoribosylformylglycinamidine cyclo-ligase